MNGATRGQIWLDGVCSDQGYFPLNVSFLDWYEKWLDDILIYKSGTWWFES